MCTFGSYWMSHYQLWLAGVDSGLWLGNTVIRFDWRSHTCRLRKCQHHPGWCKISQSLGKICNWTYCVLLQIQFVVSIWHFWSVKCLGNVRNVVFRVFLVKLYRIFTVFEWFWVYLLCFLCFRCFVANFVLPKIKHFWGVNSCCVKLEWCKENDIFHICNLSSYWMTYSQLWLART